MKKVLLVVLLMIVFTGCNKKTETDNDYSKTVIFSEGFYNILTNANSVSQVMISNEDTLIFEIDATLYVYTISTESYETYTFGINDTFYNYLHLGFAPLNVILFENHKLIQLDEHQAVVKEIDIPYGNTVIRVGAYLIEYSSLYAVDRNVTIYDLELRIVNTYEHRALFDYEGHQFETFYTQDVDGKLFQYNNGEITDLKLRFNDNITKVFAYDEGVIITTYNALTTQYQMFRIEEGIQSAIRTFDSIPFPTIKDGILSVREDSKPLAQYYFFNELDELQETYQSSIMLTQLPNQLSVGSISNNEVVVFGIDASVEEHYVLDNDDLLKEELFTIGSYISTDNINTVPSVLITPNGTIQTVRYYKPSYLDILVYQDITSNKVYYLDENKRVDITESDFGKNYQFLFDTNQTFYITETGFGFDYSESGALTSVLFRRDGTLVSSAALISENFYVFPGVTFTDAQYYRMIFTDTTKREAKFIYIK